MYPSMDNTQRQWQQIYLLRPAHAPPCEHWTMGQKLVFCSVLQENIWSRMCEILLKSHSTMSMGTKVGGNATFSSTLVGVLYSSERNSTVPHKQAIVIPAASATFLVAPRAKFYSKATLPAAVMQSLQCAVFAKCKGKSRN